MARRRRSTSAIEVLLDGLWEALDGLPWWACLLVGAFFWVLLRVAGGLLPSTGGPVTVLGNIFLTLGQLVFPGVCVIAGVRAALSSHSRKVAPPKVQDARPSWERYASAPSPMVADKIASEYRSPLAAGDGTTRAPDTLTGPAQVEALLDAIEWRRFEALVERCMQLQGFSTSSKSHGADGGVDLKLYRESGPDELAGVVQCKHWGSRQVGVDALRALRGAMAEFKTEQGYFATSSTYTADARAFAARNGITALDRHDLIELILSFSEADRASILRVALQGRFDVPTCANCGTKMVKRTPRQGGQAFWGCVSYPRCRNVIRICKPR